MITTFIYISKKYFKQLRYFNIGNNRSLYYNMDIKSLYI